MKARVTVTLKTGVLDPQGQAIEGSLKSLGFPVLHLCDRVRSLTLSSTEPTRRPHVQPSTSMCEKLLANTVIENYAVEISN